VELDREAAYGPWGDTIDLGTYELPTHQYTGVEPDPGTGFYYFGKRVYDPALRQWLSADPLFLSQPGQAAFAGVQLNLFQYAGNNPIRYVDPTGLDFNDYAKGFARGLTLVPVSDYEAQHMAGLTDYWAGVGDGAKVGMVTGVMTVVAGKGMIDGAGAGAAASALVAATGIGAAPGMIGGAASASTALAGLGAMAVGSVVAALAASLLAEAARQQASGRKKKDDSGSGKKPDKGEAADPAEDAPKEGKKVKRNIDVPDRKPTPGEKKQAKRDAKAKGQAKNENKAEGHRKGARKSTKGDHERADARRKREQERKKER